MRTRSQSYRMGGSLRLVHRLIYCFSILKRIDNPSQPGRSRLEELYMGKPKRSSVFALSTIKQLLRHHLCSVVSPYTAKVMWLYLGMDRRGDNGMRIFMRLLSFLAPFRWLV